MTLSTRPFSMGSFLKNRNSKKLCTCNCTIVDMVRLYIDLETYRPKKEDAFVDEKIILAGILADETPNLEASLETKVEPVLFREWEGIDEKTIVKRLHDHVKGALDTYRFTVICGFNILRFDIPLSLCKSVEHSLGKHEVNNKMWHDCFIIDYFQGLLVANDYRFKGLALENIMNVAKNFGLQPPPIDKKGEAIKELYEHGRWKEIEKHNEQDLNAVRWLDLFGAKRLIEISLREKKPLFYRQE